MSCAELGFRHIRGRTRLAARTMAGQRDHLVEAAFPQPTRITVGNQGERATGITQALAPR